MTPEWIDLPLVLAIHSRQLAAHGGLDGMLASALARPQQRFAYGDPTPNVVALAAAYAYGIARNHPFLDGNKRTAAVACEAFMNLNGYLLTATDDRAYDVFYRLAAGQLDEPALPAWLTANSAVKP